jgi:hypothetical protein
VWQASAVPHTFPRPEEPHLEAQRRPVEGACPECGAAELAEYRFGRGRGGDPQAACAMTVAIVTGTVLAADGGYTAG